MRSGWALGYRAGDNIPIWRTGAASGAFAGQNLACLNDSVMGPYLHCLRRVHRLEPHKSRVGHDFLGTFQVSV